MSEPTEPTDGPDEPASRAATVAEAAAALGISQDAVWGRIKRGTLARIEGMSGPAGAVYVDLASAGRARGNRPTVRPSDRTDHTDRPTKPSDRPTVRPSGATAAGDRASLAADLAAATARADAAEQDRDRWYAHAVALQSSLAQALALAQSERDRADRLAATVAAAAIAPGPGPILDADTGEAVPGPEGAAAGDPGEGAPDSDATRPDGLRTHLEGRSATEPPRVGVETLTGPADGPGEGGGLEVGQPADAAGTVPAPGLMGRLALGVRGLLGRD